MPDPTLHSTFSQFVPPSSAFTEKHLPDLRGKVYIITGSNTGLGKELARLLFYKNARVYIAVRSAEKAKTAIEDIKKAVPISSGQLVFLHLDLNDLSTIKSSVEAFLSKEKKLHVLFNNAGVMSPPQGSKTAQGYELQLGVNAIAPFLLTKLLSPILISTAKTEPANTVRVVWTSSSAAELLSPKPNGVDLNNLDYHTEKSTQVKYGVSKAGTYLHAVEFARRYRNCGIISLALNPGNLKTELTRHSGFGLKMMTHLVCYPPVCGSYTELFAGLSPDVTIAETGQWVVPFGRFMAIRKDLVKATKREEEGGTGIGAQFWEWTEEQVERYL